MKPRTAPKINVLTNVTMTTSSMLTDDSAPGGQMLPATERTCLFPFDDNLVEHSSRASGCPSTSSFYEYAASSVYPPSGMSLAIH
jgi:hypothetical protein